MGSRFVKSDEKIHRAGTLVVMKLTTILYIIAIVLVLAAFYTFIKDDRPQSIANYPPKNQTIVAFGDSLVAGNGSTPGNDFVSLLEEKLDQQIENLGVPGDTTEGGLERIEHVLDRDPGTVILLLGGNDYLKRIPVEETEQNLAVMIEQFQESGAVVVLLGVRGGLLRDNREAMFEDLAESYRTIYVSNVLDGLVGNIDYMDDAIHPNDNGHAVIADRVYEKMADLGY